jgi:hypothetical protein
MQIRFAGPASDMASRPILRSSSNTECGAADFAKASYEMHTAANATRRGIGVFANSTICPFNARYRMQPATGIDLAEQDRRTYADHLAVARAHTLARHAVPFTDYNGVMRHIEFVDKGV